MLRIFLRFQILGWRTRLSLAGASAAVSSAFGDRYKRRAQDPVANL